MREQPWPLDNLLQEGLPVGPVHVTGTATSSLVSMLCLACSELRLR